MPVGKAGPLHKELPLRSALQRCFAQRVVGLPIRACRQFRRQWGLSPRPVQDLLDLALERRALETQRGQFELGSHRLVIFCFGTVLPCVVEPGSPCSEDTTTLRWEFQEEAG